MMNSLSLVAIPKQERTDSVCLAHLLKDPENIYEIPVNVRKKIINQEIALTILKYRFILITYLPHQILKKNFMQIIWKNRKDMYLFDVILFLRFSPKTLLDRKFCHECFECYTSKQVLELFPSKIITRSLLEIGLRYNPSLIKDIDQTKLNKKLIRLTLNSYGIGLKYLSEKFIDKTTSRLGIQNNPRALKYAKFRSIKN